VDESGVQLAYTAPFELKNAEYSTADWFKSAIQTDVFISDTKNPLAREPVWAFPSVTALSTRWAVWGRRD